LKAAEDLKLIKEIFFGSVFGAT